MDAVFYLLDAMRLLRGKALEETTIFNNGPSSTSVMDHFDQALKFIQASRQDEARIYLEELLKQDPENVDLLYNLGMLYTELGKPKSAIPLLKDVH
jgi:tetratricopeptide (TPR) repeat protein